MVRPDRSRARGAYGRDMTANTPTSTLTRFTVQRHAGRRHPLPARRGRGDGGRTRWPRTPSTAWSSAGRPWGIVSDLDLIASLPSRSVEATAGELAASDVVVVDPSDTLQHAGPAHGRARHRPPGCRLTRDRQARRHPVDARRGSLGRGLAPHAGQLVGGGSGERQLRLGTAATGSAARRGNFVHLWWSPMPRFTFFLQTGSYVHLGKPSAPRFTKRSVWDQNVHLDVMSAPRCTFRALRRGWHLRRPTQPQLAEPPTAGPLPAR